MGLGRQKPIWSQIQVRGVQSNKKGFYRASDIKRYWEIWDCPAQKKKYSWNLLSIYKYWWGQQGRLTQTDPEEVRGNKHKLKYHQQKEDSKRTLIRSVDCEVDWKAEAELKG